MDVSIIIVTRDRAADLQDTLESLARTRVPTGLEIEVLVVDNASTDSTPDVVASARTGKMAIRYLREGTPGLSHGRNTGMANTIGKVILFTDDDVRFPNHWIEPMTGPILEGTTDVVGGGVVLAPQLKRTWMQAAHLSALSSTERYSGSEERVFIGANMAFRRDILSRVPLFDTELGAGALGFKEESLFADQVQAAGYRFLSRLSTAVEHHFQANRLSRKAFLSTAARRGHSSAYVDHHWHHLIRANPRKERLLAEARLAWYRARRAGEWSSTEGCPEWEFRLVRKLGYWRHYPKEARRPRNYEYHGWVKLCAMGPRPSAVPPQPSLARA